MGTHTAEDTRNPNEVRFIDLATGALVFGSIARPDNNALQQEPEPAQDIELEAAFMNYDKNPTNRFGIAIT